MTERTAPGPKGHFLLGSLPEVGRDLLGFFSGCARDYGDVVSIRMGTWPAILINHPALFEQVLLSNNRNFIKHRFFWRHVTDIFGKGLLTNEGSEWLRQRRLAQPAFHRDRVSDYGEIMVGYTLRMLDRWKDGEIRDIHHDMMRLTMEIVTRTLFGIDMDDASTDAISSAFDDAVAAIAIRFRRPFRIPDWLPIPSNLRYRRAVKRLDALMYHFIEECRGREGSRDDLLSMLMDSRDEDGSAMDDEQLRDEAVTIFLAGHETTAIALSWAFYLLALHPEVQEKLHAEIRATLDGRPPSVADVSRLTLANNVINESMRLYPPAYMFGREALEDCVIGGYEVPKGTTIFLSPWIMHRDERFFDSPEEFRPERWNDDFERKLPRFAYFPFGGGPRICIGKPFAMMEATLLLTTILQRFELELAPGQDIRPFASITLRPGNGIRMKLHQRPAAVTRQDQPDSTDRARSAS